MAKAKPKNFYSYRDLVDTVRFSGAKRPFYIYGKDMYIAERLITNLYTRQLNESFLDFNFRKLDAKKMSVDSIIDECNVLPVFDDKKCVFVYDSPIFSKNKSYEKQAKELIAYLDELPDYLMLVFFSEESAVWSSVAFSYFTKKDAALDFSNVSGRLMNEWLMAGAKSLSLEISAQNMNYLVRHCGHDTGTQEVNARMLYTELTKLSSYCAGREVRQEDIKTICTSYANESMEEMLFRLSEKKLSEALYLSDALMKNNVYPTVILSAVSNHFMVMLFYKTYYEKSGVTVWEMLSEVKKTDMLRYVPKERLEKIMHQSGRFQTEEIREMIVACARYDEAVKSGKTDAKTGLMQLLCYIVS